MIKVDRDLVPPSKAAFQDLIIAEQDVKNFYKKPDREQSRYTFPSEPLRKIRDFLGTLFDETCAYCETSIDNSDLLVDRFRPVSEAADPDGTSYPECYWRLAFKWENLLLACSECIQNRGNQFPVSGPRAETATKPSVANRKERPVLLDPSVDDPISYLSFLVTGVVVPFSWETNVELNLRRGTSTIELFGLNRTDLVARRAAIIERTSKQLEDFSDLESHPDRQRFKTFIALLADLTIDNLESKSSAYMAAKRHTVARFLLAHPAIRKKLETSVTLKAVSIVEVLRKYIKVERLLKDRSASGTESNVELTAKSSTVRPAYDSYYIKRIEIQNFRSIDNLDIKLIPDSSDQGSSEQPKVQTGLDATLVSWKMMLGENGAGKSSVLKAVAMALMGEDWCDRQNFIPEQILKRNAPEDTGKIRITFSKGDPVEISLSRTDIRFVSRPEGAAGLFIRGYGSARLFKKGSEADQSKLHGSESQRLDNLFQPHELLTNPSEWLRANLGAIDSFGLSLRDVLNLPDPEKLRTPLTIVNDQIRLDTGSGPTPLVEQSDGYKSVLAFVVDIFAGLSQKTHDKSTLGGIVLIDEIDSHLHPTWKMRIVSSLRKAFPRIQFIATTHEPLCLRGLEKGEITLLRKVDSGTEIIDDLPSVADLRIDQLLTSDLFGLSSTIDPLIDEKFHNYYSLLAKSTKAIAEMPEELRNEEIERLKSELSRYNTLGFTRRDQIVYDLVDEYLAKTFRKPKKEKDVLLKETKRKIFEIWERLGTGGRAI